MNNRNNKTGKHPGGRPTKYKSEYAKLAFELCKRGAIDEYLADCFGVARSTINEWKKRHSEFSDTIKRGKMIADAKVAEALYKLATGYSYTQIKVLHNGKLVNAVKHYPPDARACIFWLRNRQPDLWREKRKPKQTCNLVVLRVEKDDAGLVGE